MTLDSSVIGTRALITHVIKRLVKPDNINTA